MPEGDSQALPQFAKYGVIFGIYAVFDPVGTKLSDDGDPFGPPPTVLESVSVSLVFFVVMIAGGWLCWQIEQRRS